MYFLEELAAEWYAYQGYFVQTNVKFGMLPAGGYEGEMDVVAFHPTRKILVHVEASMDAVSWKERRERLVKKFSHAQKHYSELFRFEYSQLEKVAIVGFGHAHPPRESMGGVTIMSIPEFVRTISRELKKKSPAEMAVPEQFPILRAMQMAVHWGT